MAENYLKRLETAETIEIGWAYEFSSFQVSKQKGIGRRAEEEQKVSGRGAKGDPANSIMTQP